MNFEFIHKIINFQAGESAEGILSVSTGYIPYLKENTLELYDMLLVEAIGQLNAWITMEMHNFQIRPVAILYREINFYQSALAENNLIVSTALRRVDDKTSLFNGNVKLGNDILLEVIEAAGSFLPIKEFADPDLCKRQFSLLSTQGMIASVQPPIKNLFIYDEMKFNLADQCLIAHKNIPSTYPFFESHFPKKPVLPISILLQNNIELGRYFINKFYQNDIIRIERISRVKMRDFIQPNDLLTTHLQITHMDVEKVILNVTNATSNKNICGGVFEFSVSPNFT